LLQVFNTHGLSVESLVGQGYDGGSNMMGACKGVQARIAQLNPAALFTHCFCHSANRAVFNAVCNKDNRAARNFFGTVEVLYAFIEGSAMRHAYFIDRQTEIAGTKLHLKGLSETRWNCRSASLTRLQQSGVLQAVLDTTEHVGDTTSDDATRGKAVGLLQSIRNFEFIVCLFSLLPVLGLLNTFSEHLQKENIDFLQATSSVSATKVEIQAMRTDDKWMEMFRAATDLANGIGINIQLRDERQMKIPWRLDDATNIQSAYMDPLTNLKINLYFNTIDRLIGQLSERLPPELSGFAYLQPLQMQAGYFTPIFRFRFLMALSKITGAS
jgi:hypothetical protein